MVLISLDPFASRKIVLVIAALLGFSALCFADPVLMAQRYNAGAAKGDSITRFGNRHLSEPAAADVPSQKAIDLPSRTQEFLPCDNSTDGSRLDRVTDVPGSMYT